MKSGLRHRLLETSENGYCLHTQRKIPALSHMRGPGLPEDRHTHAPPPPPRLVSTSPPRWQPGLDLL